MNDINEDNREYIFVDPKNDVAFRKIFGDENKKEILISFLNNILEFAGTDKEIVDITIQNPYQVPKLKELKETILDIKAVDKRNIHYIIEMQVFHTTAFEKKVLYYVSKSYYQQLNKAEEYPKLNQVIFLGFLNFKLFHKNPDYATRHLIPDEKTNENHFKDFEFNFVELPKFTKTLEELKDIKDKWIYFVKNAGNMKMIPRELEEPKELREAFESAKQMKWSKEELEAYDARGIYIQDERGRIEYALEEGMKIGEEKGIKKGKKQGMKIGEEKGIKKGKIETAKELLKMGIEIEKISRATGLKKEEIEKLT
ncbi:MAG: Rpn family recombination-promoting nuclease/putative transposase [Candidatus Aminicenantes bacterium]|jgi:predicted transposase/invertase (TIGR01784 family)